MVLSIDGLVFAFCHNLCCPLVDQTNIPLQSLFGNRFRNRENRRQENTIIVFEVVGAEGVLTVFSEVSNRERRSKSRRREERKKSVSQEFTNEKRRFFF